MARHPKDVAAWSLEIEEQQAAVDEEISDLTKQLNEVNLRTTLEAKKCENDRADQAREKRLQFEKAQLELKLDYERKIEEAKKSNVSGSLSPVKTAKLPKLVITKFGGTLTDWPRFWNQFEAEIDRSEVAGVTKFSYLKELVEPNVRTLIDGLPLHTYIHTLLELPLTGLFSHNKLTIKKYSKLIYNNNLNLKFN